MSLAKALETKTARLGVLPSGISVIENVESITDLAAINAAQLTTDTVARLSDGSQYRFNSTATTGGISATGGGRWWLLSPSGFGVNVKTFGAAGDGINDDATAINAADAALIGDLDGDTYTSNGSLYFPAGTYRANSPLNYRGNRWLGDGVDATIIDYRGATVCLDARGADANHRKKLSVSGIKFVGTNAVAGTVGAALAHNYRSSKAFNDVEIYDFPSWGLAFTDDNWIMSFNDLKIIDCAGGGMTDSDALGSPAAPLAGFVFNNLVLENNGTLKASGKGGGIHMAVAGGISVWQLNGGTVESNIGEAEVFVVGGTIFFCGVYIESESAKVNYVAKINASSFGFHGGRILGDNGAVAGIHLLGLANGTIIDVLFSNMVASNVVAENDTLVRVIGDNVTITANGTASVITLKSDGIRKAGNDWTDFVLLNAWVNNGAPYSNAGYQKDLEGYVTLRGAINGGVISTNAASLPVGFRPASVTIFSVWTNAGLGMLIVYPDGTVLPNAGGVDHFSLNGVRFKAV